MNTNDKTTQFQQVHCSGYRMRIEAVGLRQSDAAAYALRLIGMMMQEAHTNGHHFDGEAGNAAGKWEIYERNET